MTIHLFTNVRRKGMMKLVFKAPVTKVDDVVIDIHPIEGLGISIHEIPLVKNEIEVFAQKDGFENAAEMHAFWVKHHYKRKLADRNGYQLWVGQVIHWDFEKRSTDAA